MRKIIENGAQNLEKSVPKWIKIAFRREPMQKNRKSVKTSNAPSFLVHFCYPRASKIQQNSLKSGVENEIKIKCDFEVDVSRILEDFGAILDPKSFKKERKTA